MQIDEKQAIDYITGFTLIMRKKIEILDSNMSEDNDFYIDQNDRIMAECLEIVLRKAKANIMFIKKDTKNAD